MRIQVISIAVGIEFLHKKTNLGIFLDLSLIIIYSLAIKLNTSTPVSINSSKNSYSSEWIAG